MYLGFDIGGTKCAVVTAKYEDGALTVLKRECLPTDLSVSPYEMLDRLIALGREGDVLLAISTSGSSENVLEAARVARGLGMSVIALTGERGGALLTESDVCIRVPERETYRVQELHLPVYHAICAEVEEYFYSK